MLVVLSVKLRLFVMPTNLGDREREREKKEKVGNRPAKLNEKKNDRDLQRGIKNKGDIFVGRTT